MRDRRRLGLGAAAIAATILALPSLVEAQAWLDDRARTEGPGFRVGDFELHPGLGVELGYDSNVFYSDEDGTFPRVDSAILRATAHLLFSTRGPQRRQEGEAGGGSEQSQANAPLPSVTFRGGLSGSFYHFFNAGDRTNMEVDASLALSILPGRPFSINIYEDFSRGIRPFAENSSIFASFGRIQNSAGVDLNFATSGEVLKISTGYRFGLDFFEANVFQYGNNFRHIVTLSETFRFLPQTAIVHDTSFTVQDYWTSADPTAPTLVNDGFTLRTRVGLNGALTSNFSVLAMVGYAAGFFNSPSAVYDMEYESVIAQVEARWQITQSMRLAFGYDRDFAPSFLGNFYRRDRGYANYQAIIDRVFLLGVSAEVGGYEFGTVVRPDGMSPIGSSLNRADIRLIASIFAEYRFTDWLGVNGTLRYTGAFTDFQYTVLTGPGASVLDPAAYNKFEAWLGVRVFY